MTILEDRFIESVFALSKERISETVTHQAKRCLVDYLGATLAGSRMSGSQSFRLLQEFGASTDEATLIGFDQKTSVMNAVFINGVSAHIAELDDGIRFGQLHPGSPVISALLPVAEKHGVSGHRLLLGIIVGYEAAARMACAIQPSHYRRGYHPTGTCGAIGASIGLASMLELSRVEMKTAFSSAAMAATGTLKVLEDNSQFKPFNVANAAKAGFVAVCAAKAGFVGPEDVLSGASGFLSMMADDVDYSQLERGPAGALWIEKVYTKPYAACRHAHAPIEAAMTIRSLGLNDLSAIRSIRVLTYRSVIGKHDHRKVISQNSAKMSIPYSVAVALKTGRAGLEEFSDQCLGDPEVMELAQKVEVQSDEAITRLVPRKRCAVLQIELSGGQRFEERIDLPKGEPETKMSDQELGEKFTSLALYSGKTAEQCDAMLQSAWAVEDQLTQLYELL